MKKFILLFFTIFLTLNFSNEQTTYRIYPESYKPFDIIFPENDKLKNYEYNLIDAKVLTKEEITLYLKKQGIHLSYDDCCKELRDVNVWDNIMKEKSDFREIYSNAKYNESGNKITYKFPINKIENKGYTVSHKLWVINKNEGQTELSVYFNYEDNTISPQIIIDNQKVDQATFIEIIITCDSTTNNVYENYVKYKINNFSYNEKKTLLGSISSITFEYSSKIYSPAIALHWTYYKIEIAISNFSLKGNSLCDKITNPCISGYYYIGGVCKKCHPSCFDCVNGGLSTDCYTKCNTNSVYTTPNKGTCTLGYVDLNQFEDFDIEDIIPPPRNNRLTISFWMYVNGFPENEVTPSITNSFSEDINLNFKFATNKLQISCGVNTGNDMDKNMLNSWFFTKCAISYDHADDEKYLYIKYFDKDANSYKYIYRRNNEKSLNRTNCNNHDFKKYYEPDDYISLHFYKFNQLSHIEYSCNVYIKQLVLFREFLPEPYDNKYFSVEKLMTSTLDLPEVLFIIPFDELKKESNKYKVKCYSYPGNIEENEIILTPKESGDTFSLYPPKLFKRLNLLEKNKKYLTTDLIEVGDLTFDSKVLIASYDNIPLTCIDENFLYFSSDISETDPANYAGKCDSICEAGYSMIYGLGDRKGFCNKACNNDNNEKECLSKGEDLLVLNEKFECKTGFYNMFYKCEDESLEEQKKNIFYYDPHYNPANIFLDVRHYNLKSYIIEFWYHYADCGRITSGYIFYSNQIQIKKVEESYNVYTTAHNVRNYTIINHNQWNHIVIEVYYDPRQDRNHKTKIYLQTGLNSGNPIEIDHSENPYPLDYIYFCNGRRSSCNNIEMSWFCGYYRNLRLFNGELSQRHVTFRYDEYYSEYPYLLSSIVLYYPLYGNILQIIF